MRSPPNVLFNAGLSISVGMQSAVIESDNKPSAIVNDMQDNWTGNRFSKTNVFIAVRTRYIKRLTNNVLKDYTLGISAYSPRQLSTLHGLFTQFATVLHLRVNRKFGYVEVYTWCFTL